MLVRYDLGRGRNTSELVKENEKTVWVTVTNKKGKQVTIKRHKEKHHVEEVK